MPVACLLCDDWHALPARGLGLWLQTPSEHTPVKPLCCVLRILIIIVLQRAVPKCAECATDDGGEFIIAARVYLFHSCILQDYGYSYDPVFRQLERDLLLGKLDLVAGSSV